MEWNRSETLALAAHKCVRCEGKGVKIGRAGSETPCNCVLRSIFRACYARFRECANKDIMSSRVSLEHSVVREAGGMWSRVNEEYVADFLLIAKRTLTEEEHRIFRFHFLLGADWRLCCRKLNFDKGRFFHSIYRIQSKLGKQFREMQPYPLYPVREYFSSTMRSGTVVSRAARPTLPMAA